MLEKTNPSSGLQMVVGCLAFGSIGVISLLAFAEGIELALDIAAHLRDIRNRLSDR